ncbi:glycosyltransferase [Veillonella ratti]|uniref:glycosyltransferase n=1 Tax=Veillonella ratti TaxID=103892 RepID=UPI000F8E558C|nr:glycosyltransferase [Veillonella ratti]
MQILLANFTKMVQDTGGLAKVTCAFANEMVKRGHEVSLMYSDEREGEFFYPIDKNVKLYNIKKKLNGKVVKFPIHLKAVREILRMFSKRSGRTVNSWFEETYLLESITSYYNEIKPDIVISYQPAASKLLLCDMNISEPVVTMSHGDPEDYFYLYPRKEIPSLEKSAVCQVLMPSFEEHIKRHLPNVKTVVIGNAIPQFEEQADLVSEKAQYRIAFMGRLTKNHKRPHVLIEAFKVLHKKYPNWVVDIWGKKDRETYYKELELLIKSSGLADKVFIHGATEDVPGALSKADIFACPSAYEGFGMAVGEAMSIGLPAVAFKSCSGVNELIEHDKTGILCDDGVEAFTAALESLMANTKLRQTMGESARVAMKKYAPQSIWNQWEDLMKDIISKAK